MKKTKDTKRPDVLKKAIKSSTPGKGAKGMTPREAAVLNYVTRDKLIDRQIADKLGISTVAVYKIRTKLGLPPNRKSVTDEHKHPKVVYSEDKYLLERRFGAKYLSRNMHHRPAIITIAGQNLLPSFYDSATNSFVFLVSKQSWQQMKRQFMKIATIFRANNFVLINGKTMEEFVPGGDEVGYLVDILHKNYEIFVSTNTLKKEEQSEVLHKKAS